MRTQGAGSVTTARHSAYAEIDWEDGVADVGSSSIVVARVSPASMPVAGPAELLCATEGAAS